MESTTVDSAAHLKHPVARLRAAWVEFLARYYWDWFATFTFDPSLHSSPNGLIHPEKAHKAARLFIHELNSELYGKNWKRRGESIHWVLANEFHKSGILHMHGLMGGVQNLNEIAVRMEWVEWWKRHFGIARIYEPRSQGGVQGYCTKYVVKGGELELSENLAAPARQFGLGLRGGRPKQ